jgi:hypothetical protein
MNEPMVEVSAIVAAPTDVVLERVAGHLGGHGWTFDRDSRMVFLQGGWWYRGEYTATDVPGGSRLTHRVFNVASRGRWAVPLANRLFIGFRGKVAASFADLVSALGEGQERSRVGR